MYAETCLSWLILFAAYNITTDVCLLEREARMKHAIRSSFLVNQ